MLNHPTPGPKGPAIQPLSGSSDRTPADQPARLGWAGTPEDRLRTAWLLLSPSRVIVAVGVDHGDLLLAAGLPALPEGWTVATLQVTGSPEAFDHVLDPVLHAWSPLRSAELEREQRRLSRLLESRFREVLSLRLARGDDGAREALVELGDEPWVGEDTADEDTAELPVAPVRL